MTGILGYGVAVLALGAACGSWVLVQRWALRRTGRDTAGCATCDLRRPDRADCR